MMASVRTISERDLLWFLRRICYGSSTKRKLSIGPKAEFSKTSELSVVGRRMVVVSALVDVECYTWHCVY